MRLPKVRRYLDLTRRPSSTPGVFIVERGGREVARIHRLGQYRHVGVMPDVADPIGPFQNAARVVREIRRILTTTS